MSNAISIEVRCLAPKYAKGEYKFTKFEDFLRWLAHIRSMSKGSPGRLLYGLVKTGYLKLFSGHYTIDVVSNFHDYSIAENVASKVGLLTTRWGSDHFSNKPELALQFAKALDEFLSKNKLRQS